MTARHVMVQALRSMHRYKLRTFFMMLGSFVGVAALTFVVSVAQGSVSGLVRMVKQTVGDGGIVIAAGGSRIGGGAHAGAMRLTIDDAAAVAHEVPGIDAWDSQAELRETIRHGDVTTMARVLGGSERWSRAWGRRVSRGETFGAAAVAGASRDALIGETVARRIFPNADPVGGEIHIGAVPFRVIGVLESFGTDMHGTDRDNEIVVPLTTLMRRLSNRDAITAAKFVASDPAQQDDVAAAMRRVLRARHKLDRDQTNDFMVLTSSGMLRNVGVFERIALLYVPLVGGVVLLVGGIVAATLMLASVNERVAEIGLRRAVGARPDDIRRQFLAETAATVVVGGVGGVVVGLLGVQLAATRFPLETTVSWAAVGISIVSSIVVGLLAGVVPAHRAARLRPADALR